MHKGDLTHSRDDLQEKLEEIYALRRTRSKVNWDQDKFLKLLKDFGDPHLSLPPVIHVAGTNGKGSVIAMLRSILEEEGYDVHAYTSPHLIDVNERIVLAGQKISNEKLSELIDQALDYADGAPLSFFEMMTAIAFRAFAERCADVLLLEVGMGGRLDCTNVIDAPIATVINRISMDHMEFLGDTLEDIAAEKAGIMKKGVPCLIGAQEDAALEVLRDRAEEVGADIVSDWSVSMVACELTGDPNAGYTDFTYQGEHYILPLPSLYGDHQIQNAGLAVATVLSVADHLPVSSDSIAMGLHTVRWPGRLQKINPRAFGVERTAEIWLDCGHNDSAGAALAAHVQAQDKPVFLILGMLKTKEVDAFLVPLRPLAEDIYVVPLPQDDCYGADDIPGSYGCAGVREAVQEIVKAQKNVCILIAGSVYLVGEVLKTLRSTE